MGFDVWKGAVTHEQTVADTTWTIEHGMGIKSPVVDVWTFINGNYERILPLNIAAPDHNTVVITFSIPFTGRAIIC